MIRASGGPDTPQRNKKSIPDLHVHENFFPLANPVSTYHMINAQESYH